MTAAGSQVDFRAWFKQGVYMVYSRRAPVTFIRGRGLGFITSAIDLEAGNGKRLWLGVLDSVEGMQGLGMYLAFSLSG